MAERTDLFRLLAELERAGVNNTAVGLLIEVSRYKLMRWKLGGAGEYDEVKRLVELHAKVCLADNESADSHPKTGPASV